MKEVVGKVVSKLQKIITLRKNSLVKSRDIRKELLSCRKSEKIEPSLERLLLGQSIFLISYEELFEGG